jgi:dynein heavy chain, axonemal
MVQIFHTSTQEQAKRFFKEKRRHYYITPTSYLEMIKAFQLLLGEKRKAVMTLKDKYSNGYDTLIETEEKVNTMKEELIELQPQLVVKAKEVAESTAIVTEKTDAANIVKEAVSKEEAIAQESANAANAIKNDCESELAKALPALREATKALDAIGKADIAEMKGNNNPIPAVLLVMTAVGLLFGLVPEKKMNPQTQKKEEFWWPPI